jgi:hypothetical protein
MFIHTLCHPALEKKHTKSNGNKEVIKPPFGNSVRKTHVCSDYEHDHSGA